MQQDYAIIRLVGPTPSKSYMSLLTEGTILGRIDRDMEQPQAVIDSEKLSDKDAESLKRDPAVLSVAPVFPTRLIEPVTRSSATTAGNIAWGVEAVEANQSTCNGSGVKVAVLDTGIDDGHAAFQGINITQQDFSGSGNGDTNGHGTHCAGTIFGRDVNGTRIGVAPGVTEVYIGKVLNNRGSGDTVMLMRGLQWAIDNCVDVVSMSLGFDFPGMVNNWVKYQGVPVDLATSKALESYRHTLRAFDSLMNYLGARAAFGSNAIVVAAAGNENHPSRFNAFEISVSLPAGAENVLSVGALEKTPAGLRVASFSNSLPRLSAPGVDILSAAAGGGLASMTGTSMACPHVAGVTALWWDYVRQTGTSSHLSSQQVFAKVQASASVQNIVSGADPADYGLGCVNAP